MSHANRPVAAVLGATFATLAGCADAPTSTSAPAPPLADARPHEVVAPHGARRVDEYYWLRDDTRQAPPVLDYLHAENAYADAMLAPLKPLRDTIYGELIGRIQQDDASVPYFYRGHWLYTRYETGKEYPIHARKPGALDAAEQVLLDVNALADGHDFYQVANFKTSPDNRLIAWLEDSVGRRQYTLRVKDLTTGKTHAIAIGGLSSSLAWSADSQSLYYVENDPVTLLTKRVKRHILGTYPADDVTVYEETDDAFYLYVNMTKSEKYVCIRARSTVTTEVRCTEAESPGAFTVLATRERDHEYDADHVGDRWVIRTNWSARNFRLMTAADGAWDDRDAWVELVAHDEDVYIDDVDVFNDFIAIGERFDGLSRLRLLFDDGRSDVVKADEPAYAMGLSTNVDPSLPTLRYTYTSLTTPMTTIDLDVKSGARDVRKVQPVPGYDPSLYATERRWVTARDGKRVPVSLLYRKGFKPDGTAALLQYGYGSYGAIIEPAFNANAISLVDRGMVYAIAHIRGGQELGRAWYEDGKLLNKMNTFTDFVDVTRALVADGYAAPNRVGAMGGSAGGLLMGAITNQAPDDYRAIVSLVPFVDVVTTMLDPTIPLTTNEYDEWGNPEQAAYYDYMLAYSPYDQIEAKAYPSIFVGTGLWDSQVQYWEPAKYVARLRAKKTDANPLIFRTAMEAGHGGKSGRFRRYEEYAEFYAFLIDQLGR